MVIRYSLSTFSYLKTAGSIGFGSVFGWSIPVRCELMGLLTVGEGVFQGGIPDHSYGNPSYPPKK